MSSRNLSLSQHLQAGQLPMFLTPREIVKHYDLGDVPLYVPDVPHTKRLGDPKSPERIDAEETTLRKKNLEAERSGLAADIEHHGVKEAVAIGYNSRYAPMLEEGHHRVAAALDYHPDTPIPVNHIFWNY